MLLLYTGRSGRGVRLVQIASRATKNSRGTFNSVPDRMSDTSLEPPVAGAPGLAETGMSSMPSMPGMPIMSERAAR